MQQVLSSRDSLMSRTCPPGWIDAYWLFLTLCEFDFVCLSWSVSSVWTACRAWTRPWSAWRWWRISSTSSTPCTWRSARIPAKPRNTPARRKPTKLYEEFLRLVFGFKDVVVSVSSVSDSPPPRRVNSLFHNLCHRLLHILSSPFLSLFFLSSSSFGLHSSFTVSDRKRRVFVF